MIPIRYYLDVTGKALDFQDAPKGKLIYFYLMEDVNLALIVDQNGEVKTTHASYVKIIGDDTERVLATFAEGVCKLGEQYVGRIHLEQFKKDVHNLKPKL